MKKTFYLFALLSLVLFSSCNKDDDPVSKYTLYSTISTRLIDSNDGSIVYSQSKGQVEFDQINMTIKFICAYKDKDGLNQMLTSPELKLVPLKGNAFYMSNGSQNSNGSYPGIIDFDSGMMWYNESNPNDGSTVYMTTQLLGYSYTTTIITNPENNESGNHQQSAYGFTLDSRGETCDLIIKNFSTNLNGVVDAPELTYKGLTVTPTQTGYKVTASSASPSTSAQSSSTHSLYTLTDVEFNIYQQCLVFNGTFKCNGLNYNVSGNLFPTE